MAERRPTPRMIDALRNGATHAKGHISQGEFEVRTLEALVGRGMADWQHTGTKAWEIIPCVITRKGRKFLADLDAKAQAAQEAAIAEAAADLPTETPAEVTDEELAEGVAKALGWMSCGQRQHLRYADASVILAVEFKRSGAVMRRCLRERRGPQIENQVVTYHSHVTRLLAAARRREAAKAQQAAAVEAQPVAEAPKTLPGVTLRLGPARPAFTPPADYTEADAAPAAEARPVTVHVDWTHREGDRLTGIVIFSLTQAEDDALKAIWVERLLVI
jgi:hypothetical protein